MGKELLIKLSYYENNYDLHEIYKTFFAQKTISFFDVDYFYLDDEPLKFVLNRNQIMSDILLDAISKYNNKHIGFNLIFKDIITYHNLNIIDGVHITIGIGAPIMIEEIGVPDFTHYLKILLPIFGMYEIESIDCIYS